MTLTHELTHKQAMQIATIGIALLCVAECLAAYHFMSQRDIASTSLVLTGWGKELIQKVVTRLSA